MATIPSDQRPPHLGLSTCQLIVDPPLPGSWNMAVDEVLMQQAAEDGTATLRLYQWDVPTLSLGYFQTYADRDQHMASRNSAVVRRSSGGGAILHDRELTYSLALPSAHVPEPYELYMKIHRVLIDALGQLADNHPAGWRLRLCDQDATPPDGEPFLCFQRRSSGDVLIQLASTEGTEMAAGQTQWKVIGSAQRRRRGAILQHGSLLLERSPAAPELPGFCDLSGVAIDIKQLTASLPSQLSAALGCELCEAVFSPESRAVAREIESTRYDTPAWTKRR